MMEVRKRAREGVGDDDSAEKSPKKSNNFYHAMKVASTAKRFTEAVDLCTEALKEENLTKANRTKFLLARSSIYSQIENSFSLAIRDAKNAILLSPTHAMGYLRAAKAFHQEGHKAKATQALAKAASLTNDTMSELSSYIRDLQREWNVPHIQAIPSEILAEIFGNLEIKDLLACTLTCRRWKAITTSNWKIWCSPVTLRGTIKQVDAKWKAFYKLTKGGQTTSLTIDLTSDIRSTPKELQKAWNLTTLRNTFPSKTLTHFDYTGREYSMDEQIWSCVTTCTKLKSIRWKSKKINRREDSQIPRNVVRYQIKGTPLADCRLEEFHFDDPTSIADDVAFTQIFSEVKRLYLVMYIPCISWPDLAPWQQNLVEFDYYFENSIHREDVIEQHLYRLPNCESLMLSFKNPVIMTRFWELIRSEDEALRILPKLKRLKIAGLSTITGANLINFIRFRIAKGAPIETLYIYQSEQVDHKSVAWLRRTVPDFIYSSSLVGR